MLSNRQIEDVLMNIGGTRQDLQKSVVGLDNANFGELLPMEFVHEVITDIRDKSDLLNKITTYTVGQQAGTVPIIRLNEPSLRYVPPNAGITHAVAPATDRVSYNCKKFRSDLIILHEELREARRLSIADFENKLVDMWTTKLANDLTRIAVQSDDSLDESTAENRMLRAFDGLLVQTDTDSTVIDVAGAGFAKGIFDILIDNIDSEYENDPNLQWIMNTRVNNRWMTSLSKLGTALGDTVLTGGGQFSPHGKPKIICPYIPDTLGSSGTPDAVADDGDGTMTIKVNTISGGQAEANAGRTIKVTFTNTGLSEILTSTWSGADVIIQTSGALGQDTISTTTSLYTVKIHDETTVMLMNPLGLILVLCDAWRSTREYNKDFDRIEITTYLEADEIIPIKEAITKLTGMKAPRMTSYTAETLP